MEELKREQALDFFLIKILDDVIHLHPLTISDQLQKWTESISYFWTRIGVYTQKELFKIGENSVRFVNILYFLGILIATYWLSRFFLKTLSQVAVTRKGVNRSLVYRITRLISYFVFGIGILIALSFLGFDFSNLVLLASALGVGLGFGLQSIFNNFISGIIILFESHLRVGDYIELESGLRGEVREINVRSTVITDNDGIDILIPNSQIVSQKVLNWTMKIPYRRYHIPFSVAYGTDKENVAAIVKEAALTVPYTLIKIGIPEPTLRISALGDNGIECELMVWVNEKLTKRTKKVYSDYLWAIESALHRENIEIPYPQRDIHYKTEKNKKSAPKRKKK